jgi:hypothetical protein
MEYEPTNPTHRRELAAAIIVKLEQLGFTRRNGYREAVYVRTREPNVTVMVYTTIVQGAARAVGEDAIRVALVYEGKPQDRGLAKDRPVHRVGTIDAIVGRLLDRVESAQTAELHRCRRCNGPAFLSRAEVPTCAAICWERHVLPVAPTPAPAPKPARAAAAAAPPVERPMRERIPVMGRRGRGAPAAVDW